MQGTATTHSFHSFGKMAADANLIAFKLLLEGGNDASATSFIQNLNFAEQAALMKEKILQAQPWNKCLTPRQQCAVPIQYN